ncbi:hypothetical protein K438DRAFT_1761603 [Mycena galopus ATCC 62051]|nr:hypothetical protein K438DRAFT_1761603 [Mycena galopus ATCC 62051]
MTAAIEWVNLPASYSSTTMQQSSIATGLRALFMLLPAGIRGLSHPRTAEGSPLIPTVTGQNRDARLRFQPYRIPYGSVQMRPYPVFYDRKKTVTCPSETQTNTDFGCPKVLEFREIETRLWCRVRNDFVNYGAKITCKDSWLTDREVTSFAFRFSDFTLARSGTRRRKPDWPVDIFQDRQGQTSQSS